MAESKKRVSWQVVQWELEAKSFSGIKQNIGYMYRN